MRNVQCPYCGNPANLADSAIIYGRSYGMIWDCRPCDAYVGTHKNSKDHAPLGRLANRELREWKKRAHAAFDPLWKSGQLSRPQAYKHMQQIMGMAEAEAHIGKFDVADCKRLVEALGDSQGAMGRADRQIGRWLATGPETPQAPVRFEVCGR